jgi:hypothetical protein
MNAFSDHPFQLRECQDSEGDRLRPLHKNVVRKTERELLILFHHPIGCLRIWLSLMPRDQSDAAILKAEDPYLGYYAENLPDK